MEKSELPVIRFTGKNYPSWAFQFQVYMEGKEMWGHITGSDPKPSVDEKKIFSWTTKDAKIKSWILGSVEPHLILNLKPYKTSKDMWGYLKKVYHKSNSARQYQLEFEIAQYTQGTSSIQDYYSGFLKLWTEFDEIKYAHVSEAALSEIQTLQETSHRDQFLMKLRPEYETVRSGLTGRVPSPSLDECLNELFCEEQRQLTQVALTQEATSGPLEVAYVAKSHFPAPPHPIGQLLLLIEVKSKDVT